MTPERWRQVTAIFHAARVHKRDLRDAFLAQACGADSALRLEVEAMLKADDEGSRAVDAIAFTEITPQLSPGTTLGPYKIDKLIGVGGMGEVYRARDQRLGRDIALKVLPPGLASNPERLQRFEREAHAAAALNHPNIVTIHSVEQAGELHFLTMELVEGTPLSDRIPADGFPFDRLLEIAVPLADAVGAAHARGIVHRDLKPANVMMTPEGRIKVLDFGVAKFEQRSSAAEATVPTLTSEGSLLGTVAYMSPEQAEGRDADHRSDIFSTGVLLYELATGRRPFAGDSSVNFLSSILKDTPRLVTDLKPALPRELGRIVGRCLMKDPGRRYQSAIDLRNDLEDLEREVAAGVSATSGAVPHRSRLLRRYAWMTGGLAVLAATAFAYLAWRGDNGVRSVSQPSAAPPFAGRAEFPVPVPESVKVIESLSVSPDGTRLVFAGGNQLWLYDLATRRPPSPVTGIVGAPPQYPFWSPDGRLAYFQRGEPTKLMQIPAEGGIPERICYLTSAPVGGSWGREDTIVFAQTHDGLYRVPAAGGAPVQITSLDKAKGELGHQWPHFLPDGLHFTYLTFENQNKVYIGSLDPNEPRRLVAPGREDPRAVESRAFALSGFLLTSEHGVLRARPLSAGSTEPAGEPVSLAQNIRISGISGDFSFAASPSVLAYSALDEGRRSQFSIVDRRGQEIASVGSPVLLGRFGNRWSISPTGGILAFSEVEHDRTSHIALLDLTLGTSRRFSFTSGRDWLPVWNRSGDQIVFLSSGLEGQDLYVKRLGSEREARIGESNVVFKMTQDWHPDGTVLFAIMTPPANQYNLWLVRPDGGSKPEHWLPSKANHLNAQFSPDGQWVAYQSNETDAVEVHVRRFPTSDGQLIVSRAGGNWPRWRPDGKALFYLQDDTLMEVELNIGTSVKPGAPHKMFPVGENCGYAVLPDGKRFVLCRRIDPVPLPTLTVVVNWTVGLEHR